MNWIIPLSPRVSVYHSHRLILLIRWGEGWAPLTFKPFNPKLKRSNKMIVRYQFSVRSENYFGTCIDLRTESWSDFVPCLYQNNNTVKIKFHLFISPYKSQHGTEHNSTNTDRKSRKCNSNWSVCKDLSLSVDAYHMYKLITDHQILTPLDQVIDNI